MRILMHEKYMMEALAEAIVAKKESELPIGCVIVKNGELIAKAHNKTSSNSNELSHAELLALLQLDSFRKNLSDCILYSTLEPCAMCTGAIINSGIKNIVFGAYDKQYGCCFSKLDLFSVLGSEAKIIGGILQPECSSLINEFFALKRDSSKSNTIAFHS